MDSASQLSSTLIPPESKLAVSQISDLFSLLFSILHCPICSAAFMLNTAHDQVRTVNHAPVPHLYSRLIVCFGREGAYLNFIIVIQIALLVVTVLGFHIWQHKVQRRVAVAGLLGCSPNCRCCQQVKFSVPTDQKLYILLLRYEIMQELVQLAFDLCRPFYFTMPKETNSVYLHSYHLKMSLLIFLMILLCLLSNIS